MSIPPLLLLRVGLGLVVIGLHAWLAGYAWRRRWVPGAQAFLWIALAGGTWALAYMLIGVCVQPTLPGLKFCGLSWDLFWARVGAGCEFFFPVAWLVLVLGQTGHQSWITRPRLAGSLAIPVLIQVLLWSGVISSLPLLERPSPANAAEYTWLWIALLYPGLLIGISLVLLSGSYPQVRGIGREQRLIFIATAILPGIWGMLKVFKIPVVSDLLSLLLGVETLLAAVGLFRYRFFQLAPMARAALLESMEDGLLVLDPGGRIVDVNAATCHMLGWKNSDGELKPRLGRNILHVLPDNHLLYRFSRALLRGKREERRMEIPLAVNGETLAVEVRARSLSNPTGQRAGWLLVLGNITAQKASQGALEITQAQLALRVTELEARNQELSLLTEMAKALMACPDLQAAYQEIARWAGQLFPDLSGLVMLLDEDQNTFQVRSSWGSPLFPPLPFKRDQCWAFWSASVYHENGPTYAPLCQHFSFETPVSFLCLPIGIRDQLMGVLHLQCQETNGGLSPARQNLALLMAEQIGLALANLRMRHYLLAQAIRDRLTGLYNRFYMEEALQREISLAQRTGDPVCLLLFDLDFFKNVNDAYGHEAGDRVLREIGKRLQATVRRSDIACRFGGEEFLVIMPQIQAEAALARAGEFRQLIKNMPVTYQGREIRLTVSIGVACWPEHGDSLASLLRAADLAMYEAKRTGRDRVVMAAPVL